MSAAVSAHRATQGIFTVRNIQRFIKCPAKLNTPLLESI